MSCCGEKRDAAAATTRPPNPSTHPESRSRAVLVGPHPSGATASPAPGGNLGVTLRYRSLSALIVRGPITGRRYQFAGGGSMQTVDRRDAEALLTTGFFDRIWN